MSGPASAPLAVFDLRPLQCAYAERGIGRYTREILRAMRARLDADPRYRLMGLGFRGEDSLGLPCLHAPRAERVWLWDQAVLPFLLRRAGARVFHSCAALGPLKEVNFPVSWAARCALTLHDWHLWADDASPLERFYRGTRRLRWQKRFLPRAGRVLVDCAAVAEETRERGVPADRIAVVAPGGDHLDAVAGIPCPESGFVLTIGDGPHKGLDRGLAALESARRQGFDRDWLLIGNRARLRESLRMAGEWPAWIRMRESATDAELMGLYQAALCLLVPSRREGFGLPALEAMGAGCPVLAADIEPLREFVPPECRLPPEDAEAFARALLRLCGSSDYGRELAEKGRSKARGYTWTAAAEGVLAQWELIFPSGSTGPSGGTGRR